MNVTATNKASHSIFFQGSSEDQASDDGASQPEQSAKKKKKKKRKKVKLCCCLLVVVVHLHWSDKLACMPHSELIHHVQGKIKKSAVKHKVGCHCSRGPGDNRSKEASAAETEGGKRIDRTALGLSCRVGCGVHFSGRTQPGTGRIT